MHRCPNEKCANKTLYSDGWMAGSYADGSPSNICKTCLSELVAVDKVVLVESAKINTYGCSPVSNRFTH
jgi:hypothetical protein